MRDRPPCPMQGLPMPEPPAPRVSILVISYNTREMTLDCLRSLEAETTVPHEVIVVDNNSPDGSADAIAAAFPEFRLIASPDNLGFAKGNNVAAAGGEGRLPPAAQPRHRGARPRHRPAGRLRRRQSPRRHLGRAHAQRRHDAEPDERLRRPHPLGPLLPRQRPRGGAAAQQPLQPRRDGRLGPLDARATSTWCRGASFSSAATSGSGWAGSTSPS